uniref:TIL domain-containing protein n=1 Tax=Heterorhabditis bacteriophora TaxID=37862 RepID=A0A1I7WJQ4_HETBA
MLSCLALSAAITSPRKCGQNEEYSETGGHCQRTCEAPISVGPSIILPIPCRSPITSSKQLFCRFATDLQVPAKCEENEVPGYSNKCEPSCQNRNPLFCTRIGESGCLCKKGYIRSDDTHKCVPESQCPKSVECPANEVFGEIAKGCEPTCENPNPTVSIFLLLVYCSLTILQSSALYPAPSISLRPSSSPSLSQFLFLRRSLTLSKFVFSVYYNLFSFCTRIGESGCLCKKGYIRSDDTHKCVPESQCPKSKSNRKHFLITRLLLSYHPSIQCSLSCTFYLSTPFVVSLSVSVPLSTPLINSFKIRFFSFYINSVVYFFPIKLQFHFVWQ